MGKDGDGSVVADTGHGALPFRTSCFEGVIPEQGSIGAGDLESILRRDAELADVPHEAETFWVPADNANPSTSLEKIALSIFDFHVKSLRRQQAPHLNEAPLDATPCTSNKASGVQPSPRPGYRRPRSSGERGNLLPSSARVGAESGAEWWVQVRQEGHHSNMGMPFHWDKDERLLEQSGRVVCPTVSTVTYLAGYGAPTVVLESRANGNGSVVEGPLDQAFISYPVLHKHLAFDGSFLHGVPEAMRRGDDRSQKGDERPIYHFTESWEARDKPSAQSRHKSCGVPQANDSSSRSSIERRRRGPVRVTLLVNVWLSHKPAGISPLPARIAATLSRGIDIPALSFERPVDFYPVPIQRETPSSDEAVQREAQTSTVVIEAPLGPKSMLELMAPTSWRLSTGPWFQAPSAATEVTAITDSHKQIFVRSVEDVVPGDFETHLGLVGRPVVVRSSLAEFLPRRGVVCRSCRSTPGKRRRNLHKHRAIPPPGMDKDPRILSDDLLDLSRVLRPCLGPVCKQYLLVTRTLNKVVITGSGHSVLRHTLKAEQKIASSPMVRVAMSSVDAHEQAFGDATTSLVLMIAEGLRQAKELTGGSAPQMLALSRCLAAVRSRWLDQIIVPFLLSQAQGVGKAPCLGSFPLCSEHREERTEQTAHAYANPASELTGSARPASTRYRPQVAAHNRGKDLGILTHPPDTHTVREGTEFGKENPDTRKPPGVTTADGCHAPVRHEQRGHGGHGNASRKEEHLNNDLDLDVYLEHMREILSTAVGGLFPAQACHLLVELVVNWIALTAQQMHFRPAALRDALGSGASESARGGDGGGRGRSTVDTCWDVSRRYLVGAARFARRHKAALLLKAKGAGLAESRVVDDGVVLPYELIGAHPKRSESSRLIDEECLRFVVLKCPVEPFSSLPDDEQCTRVTVGVTNAEQHGELLRSRGQAMQAVIDALTASGIALVVCTHALKDPFPDLLREAGLAGLQLVETQDADYLAQRFGARAFHRLRGATTFSDDAAGTVGIARGVRPLCLGQGPQSPFCYIDGYVHQWCEKNVPAGVSRTESSASPRRTGAELPPGLACQVVLRAPSDGILVEYAACISRCLTLTLKWLEWDPPVSGLVTANPVDTTPRTLGLGSCPVVAGGGASELSLNLLLRKLSVRCKTLEGGRLAGIKEVSSPLLSQARGSELPNDLLFPDENTSPYPRGADTALKAAFENDRGSVRSMSMAFDVLAAAMLVIPRVLLENACAETKAPRSGGHTRQAARPSMLFGIEHALKNIHAVGGLSSVGLLVGTPRKIIAGEKLGDELCPGRTSAGRESLLSLTCGLKAGVVHPLAVKYGTLVALLDAMVISLRVGGVVKCRGTFVGAGSCAARGGGDNEGDGRA